MKTIKYSRQREAIKNFLKTRKDHPTADVIYENIRQDFPKISLGTVYRNLALLTELGEIQKLNCGDLSDHFDGDTSNHYHFICKGCGHVLDLDMEQIDFINILAEKNFGGSISGHNVYFYGLCKDCKENLVQ